MKTVWQRPMGVEVDIIPLAKLQTLKENTESAEHARVRRTCETQTSPAIRRVGGGSRRVIAQNIGPETGIIMTRTASRSSNGTVNGMQQSFDDFLTQREPVDRKHVGLVAQGAVATTVSIILPEHVDHAPQG
ncbi:hypothetical protein ANCDUO_17592 [Ancylostoma duodenale]|uniref:Uncharacterized protein n=1 Tax=Ancylostoma duodenale TaxID=51022 RepID=A0A0C2C7P3_9BILA|nr:hypothetical protein ANCDUO_17592 [Ancylostoma duodenale]